MIRNLLTTLFWLFIGTLVGEIPVGKSTVGRTALEQSRGALLWTGDQFQAAVTYAGLGDAEIGRWLRSVRGPSTIIPRHPRAKQNREDLTPLDEEAVRKILE